MEKRWQIVAIVVGTRVLGEVMAETEKQALETANRCFADYEMEVCASVCSHVLSDPTVEDLMAEETPDA